MSDPYAPAPESAIPQPQLEALLDDIVQGIPPPHTPEATRHWLKSPQDCRGWDAGAPPLPQTAGTTPGEGVGQGEEQAERGQKRQRVEHAHRSHTATEALRDSTAHPTPTQATGTRAGLLTPVDPEEDREPHSPARHDQTDANQPSKAHPRHKETAPTSAVGSPARPPATRPGGRGVVVVVHVVLAIVVVVTRSSGGSIISTIVPSHLFRFLNR